MRLGVSTACFFRRMPKEDTFPYISAMGARVAEVFLDTYEEYGPEFGKLLADRAGENGVAITAMHAYAPTYEPSLFAGGGIEKQEARHIFERVLKQCQLLNIKRYVMHGAFLDDVYDADTVHKSACELAHIARDSGVVLCLENVSYCMLSRPKNVREFAKSCLDGSLHFTLDIKQAARLGENAYDYLAAMGKNLAHVHLCDYLLDAGGKLKSTAMVGEGVFAFQPFFETLQNNGYDGDCMLEVYGDQYKDISELAESFRRLRMFAGLV